MRKEIQKKLREKLLEDIHVPQFRLPSNIDIDENTRKEINEVDWENIEIDDAGNDGQSIVYLNVKLPIEKDVSEAIVLDVQLVGKSEPHLYQPHINISKDLQGLGLAYKIYKKVISEFGHLYSGAGRRQNPLMDKIWNKLNDDPSMECHLSSTSNICFNPENPQKDEILDKIKKGPQN